MVRTRSLWVPIAIGVLAILFTIAVLVAWNIIFTRYYVLATQTQTIPDLGAGYWLTLSIGSLLLVLVVVALLLFLIANVRQVLYMTQQKAFIDSVTHELKSPLASILVSLETMETRKLSPEMQSKFVGMMKKDVNRLREFIEHVLTAGRIEHDEDEPHFEPVHMRDLVAESVARVRHRHSLGPETVTVSVMGHEESVVTDRVAVETVLLNLLDNAVKYSASPPKIDVTVEEVPSGTRITVADQGVGIPKSELKRVFARFYRVQRSNSHTARGTGLGLHVVSTLVKRLGGRIRANSDGEDMGARFVVDLPCRPDQPSHPNGEGR